MTSTEYNRIREMIESRFRQDMAALERVWFTIHGANPPDSPVVLKREDPDLGDLETTAGGGHPSSPPLRTKKLSGRKLGWARFRAKKAGKNPETMSEEELLAFAK